jgi:hypothetical protein
MRSPPHSISTSGSAQTRPREPLRTMVTARPAAAARLAMPCATASAPRARAAASPET